MANVLIDERTMHAIGDAIREKTGKTDLILPSDMPSEIEGISVGGGDNLADAIIEGSVTEVRSNVRSVVDYAFYNFKQITTVNLPAAESIGVSAFYNCDKLTTANISNTKNIGNSAFYNCINLQSVNCSNAISLGNKVFSGCSYLKDVSFPELTNVGTNVYENCTGITTANFPNLQSIGSSMFNYCYSLKDVNFPAVTSIGTYAFERCIELTTIDFPKTKTVGTYAFSNCYKLLSLDFSVLESIGNYTFYKCSQFKSLIIRSEKVCALSNINAFTECYHFNGTVNSTYNPDGLKDGYIYVPRALVEDYKEATNWSTFATQFRALEDYTVDGTTTGALDESKI